MQKGHEYLTSHKGTNYATNTSIHLRSLVKSETIKDGSGAVEAYTEYEYDNYASDTYHAGLLGQSGGNYTVYPISTHASSLNTPTHTASYETRGNVTNVTVKTSSGGTVLTSRWMQYDIYGNVVKTIAPRAAESGQSVANHTVEITYVYDQSGAIDDEIYYAYPTATKRWVTPAAGGSAVALETAASFFRWTGQVKTIRGYNGTGETSTFEYDDALNRLTRVVRPSGSGETQLVYSSQYDPLAITERTLQASGDWIETTTTYDGLYRVKQVDREDAGPGGIVRTVTKYDALGRPWLVSNPHRPGMWSATDGWTRTLYDEQGRVVKVSSFCNSISQPPTATETSDTGDVTTVYDGPTVTVTDQAGKQRRSRTDALGRLVEVLEPTAAGALTISTTYGYDARGNLISVTQPDATHGTQTRAFKYDALSRLVYARNPEQDATISEAGGTWSQKYVYDLASNLTQRIDARSISVSFAYDELNRVLTKDYSNTAGRASAYKDAVYVYDDSALPTAKINGTLGMPPSPYARGSAKGRLVAVITNPTTSSETNQELTAVFYGYDSAGRVTSHSQFLESQHFVTERTYNLASALDLEKYYRSISGSQALVSTIDNDYNNAGQLRTVTRTPAGGSASVVSGLMMYAPSGGLASQRMGSSSSSYLYHTIAYNCRMQPTSIALGGAPGASDLFELSYDYGLQPSPLDKGAVLDQTKNNGNVGRITIRPGSGHQGYEQDFAYDELNRLQLAKEFLGASSSLRAPSGLTASARSQSQIDLHWNDNSSAETGFEIQWRVGPSGDWSSQNTITVSANTTSYQHTGLSADTQYCYRVRAISSTAQSEYSNQACATTGVVGCAPDAPAGLTATVASNACLQVNVSWTDASTKETGFEVERADYTNGGNWVVIGRPGANVTSYTDTSLNPNATTQYCYRVRAVNASNTNPCYSDYATMACPAVTVTPCDFAVETNGQIGAYVQAADSNSLDVTGSLTVEAWVRVFQGGIDQVILSKRKLSTTSNNGGYELSISSSNKLVFATFKNDGSLATIVESTQTVPIGAWAHVAGILQYDYPTVGTRKVHVAINGILRTRNNPGASPNAAAGTTSLQLGCVLKPNGKPALGFKGKIDEVRISSTARYTANFGNSLVYRFTTVDADTKALWHMDDATGTSAADSSNNGNTASLIGGVSWTGGVQTFSKREETERTSGQGLEGPAETPEDDGVLGGASWKGSWNKTSAAWTQHFSYDRWGNRDWGSDTAMLPMPAVLGFDRLKNRITSVDGVATSYDAAGNLTGITEDALQKTFSYDAENRLYKAVVTNTASNTTQTILFVYDGEGHRVKKSASDTFGSRTECYVYNATGTLVADYAELSQAPAREYVYGPTGLAATVDSTGQVQYVTPDHLGTPRVTVTSNLTVVSRRDYYPFGESLRDSVAHNYTALRLQYTSYERDGETGLDFAQARYYFSRHGRFSSVDPESRGAVDDVAQSWNAYSYGLNNPLQNTDPTGEYWVTRSDGALGWVDDEKAPTPKGWKRIPYNSIVTVTGGTGDWSKLIGHDIKLGRNRKVDDLGPAPKEETEINFHEGPGTEFAKEYVQDAAIGAIGGRVIKGGARLWRLYKVYRALRTLGPKDRMIFELAIKKGMSGSGDYLKNVGYLMDALKQYVPHGKIFQIGTMPGGAPVFGSGSTGVGIALGAARSMQ